MFIFRMIGGRWAGRQAGEVDDRLLCQGRTNNSREIITEQPFDLFAEV